MYRRHLGGEFAFLCSSPRLHGVRLFGRGSGLRIDAAQPTDRKSSGLNTALSYITDLRRAHTAPSERHLFIASMPPSSDLLAIARAAAAYHELDPALVCAVIEQESAWNTYALRYEPGFRTRYVAPLGLPPTEEVARSISWGLMQVMGQVAREHGFDAKFLSALCDPALGLDIGCAVLASKLVTAAHEVCAVAPLGGSAGLQAREKRGELDRGFSPGSPLPQTVAEAEGPQQPGQGITSTETQIARALQLWNGGSNPNYAAQVLTRLPRYK